MTPQPVVTAGPDPVTGVVTMLSLPFVQHTLLAGTSIALLFGLAGYFVVLRGQVFAGDMLSHVAYAGALAALAAGLDPRGRPVRRHHRRRYRHRVACRQSHRRRRDHR